MSLEKFLAGEPLTDSLRRLRDGQEEAVPEEEIEPTIDPNDENPERPLTRAERIDLQHLKGSAGWLIVTRLIKRALLRRETAAKVLSQNDPLKNQEAIAREWAYVSLWRNVYIELQANVDSEIALIKSARTEAGENAGILERNEAER